MLEGKQASRRVGHQQFLALVAGLALFWNFGGVQFARVTAQPSVTVQPSPAVLGQTTVSTSGILAPPPPDCAVVACLALTFDDGPNPIATPMVLSALEQAQVPATFFVVGSRAVTQPNLLRQMYRDGDEIGDHSWSHPDLTTLPPDQVATEIAKTQQAVIEAGVPAPTIFRPPYGAINDIMKSQIHLPFILWNDDPTDWQIRDPAKIIASAEAQASPGSIVELHDIYPTTGQALPQLISDLKQHYQLVTVSQLLDLQAGQAGVYFSR